MLATLGMCEIGAIVLVDCETETTFKGPDMVLEAAREVSACWVLLKPVVGKAGRGRAHK